MKQATPRKSNLLSIYCREKNVSLLLFSCQKMSNIAKNPKEISIINNPYTSVKTRELQQESCTICINFEE